MDNPDSITKQEISLSFEEAFGRLEEILERLNSTSITLDDSLKLYEEADALIASCSKKLNDAERKIEMIVRNRSGGMALGPDGKPLTEEYSRFNEIKPS